MTFSPEQMMQFSVSLHIALSPSEAVFGKALANIYISKLNRRVVVGFFFFLFFFFFIYAQADESYFTC
jgi:hypothetical protein